MSIASALAKTAQLQQLNGGKPLPKLPFPPAEGSETPPSPPGVAPTPLPRRGLFPSNLVLASDFSDNSPEYRQGGMRSPTFPIQTGPVVATTATPAASGAGEGIQTYTPNATYQAGSVVAYQSGIYQAKTSTSAKPRVGVLAASDPNWQILASGTADNIQPGSFQSVPNAAAVSAVTGQIRLDSSQGVPPVGSISPILSSPFSYVATTTTITISWTGLTISLVNSQTISIPNGSIEITGLNPSTTYSFFPYYNGSAVQFVASVNVPSLQQLAGVQLDGSSGQITTTNSLTSPTTNFSLEAWVFVAFNHNGTIIECNANQTGTPSASSYGPGIGITNVSTVDYVTAYDKSGSDSANGPTTSAWHHIVFTSASAPGIVYIDGVATNLSYSVATGYTGYWRIGEGGFISGFFEGVLSRIAIYPSVLTPTQVANHYNTMLDAGTGPYDNLVVTDGATNYWPLQETSGTTATDTISGNNGTYTGGYTLGVSYAIGSAVGSPAIAWQNPTAAVCAAQFAQANYPLSAGASGFTVATLSTGTGGGNAAGWATPHLPYGLTF
jgi:Concanavalin A-like lectin/glucanases superfamily